MEELDIFESCLHGVSYRDYVNNSYGTNEKTIYALKKAMPLVIERELNAVEQKCITLKFFENKTQLEIAATLGISQPTVSRQINRGKAKLKKHLYYVLQTAIELDKIMLAM